MNKIKMDGAKKTNIRIISRDATISPSMKGIPVYSVPLQTTATLNIFLPPNKLNENPTSLDSNANVKVRGDDSDNSDGELDVENLERNSKTHKSTFRCLTWDLPNAEEVKEENVCIIIMKDPEMVTMIKATCESNHGSTSQLLWSLMVDIAGNFTRRLKRMKDMQLPKICTQHMDTLPLTDGQTAKVHLQQISEKLQEQISLTDVAYRFQSEDVFLGTFVQGTMESKKNYSIGKVGVIVVLSKKSKYATTEAFSEQLCRHIATNQPTSLGKISEADIKKINKRGTVKILHLQKNQLLIQNFAFDPTIIVAEAARRSFVKIEDFLFYK